MKHEAFLPISVFFISLTPFAGAADAPHPVWINSTLSGVEEPTSLSGSQQDQCTQVILDQIHESTELSVTSNDVIPIQLPDWRQAEPGFVRGGGYNIRVAKTTSETPEQLPHFHSGRFADAAAVLKMGNAPSLHLPETIDGFQTFFETEDDEGTHVDFVAHVDSAFAYLPVGLFVHLFTDVLGADTRNPCPVGSNDGTNEE